MPDHPHKRNSSNYRDLNYKEKVQSFNMTCNLLREYTRVMLEVDTTPSRSAKEVVAARMETIRKTLDAIARMA